MRSSASDAATYRELALGADAETLEQIVNRPIYPDRVPLLA